MSVFLVCPTLYSALAGSSRLADPYPFDTSTHSLGLTLQTGSGSREPHMFELRLPSAPRSPYAPAFQPPPGRVELAPASNNTTHSFALFPSLKFRQNLHLNPPKGAQRARALHLVQRPNWSEVPKNAANNSFLLLDQFIPHLALVGQSLFFLVVFVVVRLGLYFLATILIQAREKSRKKRIKASRLR